MSRLILVRFVGPLDDGPPLQHAEALADGHRDGTE
jgi:hypothetical protein